MEHKQNSSIWLVFAFWALLFVASIFAALSSPPTGGGYLRGLGPVITFFQLQLCAAIAAIIVWWMGRNLMKDSWQRWLSRLPILLVLLLMLMLIWIILFDP